MRLQETYLLVEGNQGASQSMDLGVGAPDRMALQLHVQDGLEVGAVDGLQLLCVGVPAQSHSMP